MEREKATIKELTSSWDLLSQSAFTEDKVRRGPNGDKFEFFLPLPFGEVCRAVGWSTCRCCGRWGLWGCNRGQQSGMWGLRQVFIAFLGQLPQ